MPSRTIINTKQAEILAVDLDNKDKSLTRKNILKILKSLKIEFLIYESMSSTKDHFRCRVIFTLSKPVTNNEKFRRLYLNFTSEVFGKGVADLAVSNINSYLFVGRWDQMEKSKYYTGKPIRVSKYIKKHVGFS
jgi:hypothetical protein